MKLILATAITTIFYLACNSNKPASNTPNDLASTWEVTSIPGDHQPFDSLYPGTKPSILFSTADNRCSGNTGCNNFSGSYTADANKIRFDENMAVTKKMCLNGMQGETLFLETLRKVNSYSISNSSLDLAMGDEVVMRLKKK